MKRTMVIIAVIVIVGAIAFVAGSAYGKKSYKKKMEAGADDTAEEERITPNK